MKDYWKNVESWKKIGLSLTGANDESARLFDAGIEQFVGYFEEPSVGGFENTLNNIKKNPDFVMGRVFALLTTLAGTVESPRFNPGLRAELDTLTRLRCPISPARYSLLGDATASLDLSVGSAIANEWETAHIDALTLYANGRLLDAAKVWEHILIERPRDLLAIKMAHDAYFFSSQRTQNRDSLARVMTSWPSSDPHYGYLLGMYAYGLVETREYSAAERFARQGLEHIPNDAWSAHSLAHVHEMRFESAINASHLEKWLNRYSAGQNLFHLYWHWALCLLELGDTQGALGIYDSYVGPRAAQLGRSIDLVDAISMLTRFDFLGIKVGDRWSDIFERVRPHLDDHVAIFNDAHYLLALYGAGKPDLMGQFNKSLMKYIEDSKGDTHLTNALTSTRIGPALVDSVAAFAEGDFDRVCQRFYPIRYEALDSIGGSLAQFDVWNQMLLVASLQSTNYRSLAKSLLYEREASRPGSCVTEKFVKRFDMDTVLGGQQ